MKKKNLEFILGFYILSLTKRDKTRLVCFADCWLGTADGDINLNFKAIKSNVQFIVNYFLFIRKKKQKKN